MKIIERNVNIEPYSSKLHDMYFGGKSTAIFDIECTGLNPANSQLVLSGILIPDGKGSCRVIQIFADRMTDEKEVILETIKYLSKVDYLLTYNGRHYDIPYIEKRAKKYGIDFPAYIYNLDLYRVVSSCSSLREQLPNLKQKSVEIYMGISDSRDDLISGAESVKLYNQYVKTKSPALEEKILLHNYDDLLQLYKLQPVIQHTDFHKAMYKLGFPAGSFAVKKISFKGRDLIIELSQDKNRSVNYISFPTPELPMAIQLDSRSCQGTITIPCEVLSGALYFDAFALLKGKTGALTGFPAYTNGYLIASQNNTINYMEVNAFIIELLNNLDL